MTQQSQSPPNSQPPRIVNGPTSFKNLLPKSQNHHHIVTSPVPQKISHIHQNGGIFIESSQSQSQSMLGKRKLPMNDGTSDIIDENSNHSRKNMKMMKKSDFGTTSSPFMLNANNNSNSSSIHQQQQQYHHNHHPPHNNNSSNQLINNKLHSNVPVPQKPPLPTQIQQQQQQQQQKQQITQQPIIVPPQQKQEPQPQQHVPPKIEEPKKRGRRKGSKGFDSTLNGNIPDFQAEIQQKIALSAGKRNKTTFELQQMLESHQNSSMSWTNGDVHDSNSLDRG